MSFGSRSYCFVSCSANIPVNIGFIAALAKGLSVFLVHGNRNMLLRCIGTTVWVNTWDGVGQPSLRLWFKALSLRLL